MQQRQMHGIWPCEVSCFVFETRHDCRLREIGPVLLVSWYATRRIYAKRFSKAPESHRRKCKFSFWYICEILHEKNWNFAVETAESLQSNHSYCSCVAFQSEYIKSLLKIWAKQGAISLNWFPGQSRIPTLITTPPAILLVCVHFENHRERSTCILAPIQIWTLIL